MNLNSILKGMGVAIKEVTAKFEKLEDLIMPIIKPLFDVFKREVDEGIDLIKKELQEAFEKKIEDIANESKAEFAKFSDDVNKTIEEAKKEVMSVGLDLEALAEFDIDGDGIVTPDELIPAIVLKFSKNEVKWNQVVNDLLPLALDELGLEKFSSKAVMINWFIDKAEVYDFPLNKWTHIYESYLSNI